MKKFSLLGLLTLMLIGSVQIHAGVADALYSYYFCIPSGTKEKILQGALGISTGLTTVMTQIVISTVYGIGNRASNKKIILNSLGFSTACSGIFGGAAWAATVGSINIGSKIHDFVKRRAEAREYQNKITNAIQDNDASTLSDLLYQAVFDINVGHVKTLISAGANANKDEKSYYSVLALAVIKGNIDIVKMLLEAGAQVNDHSFDAITKTKGARWPALMHAVFTKHQNINIVQLLLAAGADISLKNGDGNTALYIAINSSCSTDIIQALPLAKANINIQNNFGDSALMLAVLKQRPEIVKMLLDAGANALLENKKGKTALDLAKEYSNKEVINLLQGK